MISRASVSPKRGHCHNNSMGSVQSRGKLSQFRLPDRCRQLILAQRLSNQTAFERLPALLSTLLDTNKNTRYHPTHEFSDRRRHTHPDHTIGCSQRPANEVGAESADSAGKSKRSSTNLRRTIFPNPMITRIPGHTCVNSCTIAKYTPRHPAIIRNIASFTIHII